MTTHTVPAAVLAAVAKLPWSSCKGAANLPDTRRGCRVKPPVPHVGGKYWSVSVYACDAHGSSNTRSWDYVFDARGLPVGSGLAEKVIVEHEGRPW